MSAHSIPVFCALCVFFLSYFVCVFSFWCVFLNFMIAFFWAFCSPILIRFRVKIRVQDSEPTFPSYHRHSTGTLASRLPLPHPVPLGVARLMVSGFRFGGDTRRLAPPPVVIDPHQQPNAQGAAPRPTPPSSCCVPGSSAHGTLPRNQQSARDPMRHGCDIGVCMRNGHVRKNTEHCLPLIFVFRTTFLIWFSLLPSLLRPWVSIQSMNTDGGSVRAQSHPTVPSNGPVPKLIFPVLKYFCSIFLVSPLFFYL